MFQASIVWNICMWPTYCRCLLCLSTDNTHFFTSIFAFFLPKLILKVRLQHLPLCAFSSGVIEKCVCACVWVRERERERMREREINVSRMNEFWPHSAPVSGKKNWNETIRVFLFERKSISFNSCSQLFFFVAWWVEQKITKLKNNWLESWL